MNWYIFSAGIVAFVVGLIHSILGEVLVFKKMRREGMIPSFGGDILKESNVRILWATWHALTILGWGMAFLLLALASQSPTTEIYSLTANTVAVSTLTSSVLVLLATKGRHPGWVGLLCVSILIWIGGYYS